MSTFSQRNYINILIRECEKRGIEIPHQLKAEIEEEDLSTPRASEIIDDLKFELGWAK